MADEKTEEATPKRREDERKKGNIARSQDMTAALTMTTGVGLLFVMSPIIMEKLKNLLYYTLTHLDPKSIETNDIIALFAPYAKITGEMLLPFLLGLAVVTALIMRIQVGALFATEKIKPKMDKFQPSNIVQALKKMFWLGAYENADTISINATKINTLPIIGRRRPTISPNFSPRFLGSFAISYKIFLRMFWRPGNVANEMRAPIVNVKIFPMGVNVKIFCRAVFAREPPPTPSFCRRAFLRARLPCASYRRRFSQWKRS